VRWVGITGMVAGLPAVSADAADAKAVCLGPTADMRGAPEAKDVDDESSFQKQRLLTENECEAIRNRELRVLLLEIQQEKDDPITLSLGSKSDGATLRFKIPLSFFGWRLSRPFEKIEPP
jgi:hypothetical protein